MLSREDLFTLYLEFYNKWFSKGARIEYVNGNFFRYKRNIVCVFTPREIMAITEAKKSYFCSHKGDSCFALIGARLILEGAEIKDEYQYIHISEYSKKDFSNNKDEEEYICLVAYRKHDYIESDYPSIDDYSFKYEVCRKSEISKTHNPIESRIIYYSDAISTLNLQIDKKHNFKNWILLPIEAIPHTPGSNRTLGAGVYPPISNYNWSVATGLGVVGAGNNELRCIDIDGCQSERFVESFLNALGLPTDYQWVVETGSGEGYHIWIWCDTLPNTLLLKGESRRIFEKSKVLYFVANNFLKNTFRSIEVRWNAFCMLPPSIGPNGKDYVFKNGVPKRGMLYVKPTILFNNILEMASNSTIDYADIITHSTYDLWSDDDETETLFMCFDTETTGLPKDYKRSFKDTDNWPHIVQLSYVIFQFVDEKIKILDTRDFILKPENYKIPKESVEVHGITNEEAIEEGYNRGDVLRYFAEQLSQIDYLLGHNVDFDINVIRSEFEREKIDVVPQFAHLNTICTMKEGSKLYPQGSKWPKLKELYYELTNERLSGAHNALNDVNATMTCFENLIEMNIIDVKKKICKKDLNSISSSWS